VIPASAAERLIPERVLRARATGEWTKETWHSEAEVLDIAEARLLLGFPATTDIVSGAMFVQLVRRLVLVERRLAERS
jgi:hypothetical protein